MRSVSARGSLGRPRRRDGGGGGGGNSAARAVSCTARQVQFAAFGAAMLRKRILQDQLELHAKRVSRLRHAMQAWTVVVAQRKRRQVLVEKCITRWMREKLSRAWRSWSLALRRSQRKTLLRVMLHWAVLARENGAEREALETAVRARMSRHRVTTSFRHWNECRLSSQRKWEYAANARMRPFVRKRLLRRVLRQWRLWFTMRKLWARLSDRIDLRNGWDQLMHHTGICAALEEGADLAVTALRERRILSGCFAALSCQLGQKYLKRSFHVWRAQSQHGLTLKRRVLARCTSLGQLATYYLQRWHKRCTQRWRRPDIQYGSRKLVWDLSERLDRYRQGQARIISRAARFWKGETDCDDEDENTVTPYDKKRENLEEEFISHGTEDMNNITLRAENFREKLLQRAREERRARETGGTSYEPDESRESMEDLEYAASCRLVARQRSQKENSRAALAGLKRAKSLAILRSRRRAHEVSVESRDARRHEVFMKALDDLYDDRYLGLLRKSMHTSKGRRKHASRSGNGRSRLQGDRSSADIYDEMRVGGFGAHAALLSFLDEVHDPGRMATLESRVHAQRPFFAPQTQGSPSSTTYFSSSESDDTRSTSTSTSHESELESESESESESDSESESESDSDSESESDSESVSDSERGNESEEECDDVYLSHALKRQFASAGVVQARAQGYFALGSEEEQS